MLISNPKARESYPYVRTDLFYGDKIIKTGSCF